MLETLYEANCLDVDHIANDGETAFGDVARAYGLPAYEAFAVIDQRPKLEEHDAREWVAWRDSNAKKNGLAAATIARR